jgi:hypothetical protein
MGVVGNADSIHLVRRRQGPHWSGAQALENGSILAVLLFDELPLTPREALQGLPNLSTSSRSNARCEPRVS